MWEELRRKIKKKREIIWMDYYKKGGRWYGVEAYIDGILLIIFFPKNRVVWEIVFPYVFLARILFIWRLKHLDKKEVKEFRFDEKSFFKFYDEEIRKGLEIRTKIMNKISRRKRGYKKLIDDFIKFLEEKISPLVGYPIGRKGARGEPDPRASGGGKFMKIETRKI